MRRFPPALCIVAALLCASCTTTKYPIGASAPQTPDLAIAGTWHVTDSFMHIIPGGKDGFLFVSFNQPPAQKWEFDVARATTAQVGDNHFLNISPVPRETLDTFIFLESSASPETRMKGATPVRFWPILYRVNEGKLTLCTIDDKAAAAAVRSDEIAGTATADSADTSPTVEINAEPAALDQFMATPAGAGLFKRCSTGRRIH